MELDGVSVALYLLLVNILATLTSIFDVIYAKGAMFWERERC